MPRFSAVYWTSVLFLLATCAPRSENWIGRPCGTKGECGTGTICGAQKCNDAGVCRRYCEAATGADSGTDTSSIKCSGSQQQCGDACVDLTKDAAHCGNCNRNCGANATCINSQCACSDTFIDCDNDLSQNETNGCECASSQTCTDGVCLGDPCAGITCGANATCDGGTCKCNNGFGDCNNDIITDGCEVDTTKTFDHCGQCNAPCGVNTICEASATDGKGVCKCKSGYHNCNNDRGCECPTASSCSNQQCVSNPCAPLVCDGNADCNPTTKTCECPSGTNYRNCDNDWSDGCETNIGTSVANCGACSKPCTTTCDPGDQLVCRYPNTPICKCLPGPPI